MDRCVADAGHLVIFDRRDGAWEDKVFHRRESVGAADVHVWGMQEPLRGVMVYRVGL